MAAGTASIVKRPQGHILGACYDATVYNNGYGIAVISKTSHGLNTGDYVYIYSLLGSYNGFWYVEKIGANDFEIREYPTATVQSFVNSGSIQFCVSTVSHEYSCLHLPIVYKLKNTLWPINTGGTSRTVSSFANDSGYVKLTLSGALDTFNALNYVKISGASSSAVNGTFQVLTKTSTSVITINLPYNAAYSFSGGSVILYYNNYKIQVNIWAGLNASHAWAAINPYRQILSFAVVPDGNNIVTLNINEFLKPAQNIISNNLQLDTLPNNTDFFSQFYIEFQEMYDQSDGTNVTTYSADLVSDKSNFEGVAINAKLPFKNRYSGYLNDYIMNGFGKFLTIFATPVLFSCQNNLGCYQDVSFVLKPNLYSHITALTLRQTYFINGVEQGTTDLSITYSGIGLYRVPVSYNNTAWDSVKIKLLGSFIGSSVLDKSSLAQEAGTGTWSDVGGTYPIQYSNATPGTSRIVYFDFKAPPGTYTVSGTFNTSWATGTGTLLCYFLDENLNIISTGTPSTVSPTFGGIGGGTMSSSVPIRYVAIKGSFISGSGTMLVGLNYSITGDGVLSETKIYKITSKCSDQSIMLSWLNQLGGFDYWQFNGRSTHGLDISKVSQMTKNIFTDWPNSWGEFANTIRSETERISFTKTLVRSQNLDKDQVDAIATIKSSPLVQIVNSQYDTRTVLVDSTSFDIRKDGDKNWSISFGIVYTDPISAQEL